MQLLKDDIGKDGEGHITVLPEEVDDLWHIYNLIQRSDRIGAKTKRKVTTTTAGGGMRTDKKILRLTVAAEKIEFDSGDAEIRVSGKNRTKSQFIQMNQYHTLKVQLQTVVTISKRLWDSVHKEQLKRALDLRSKRGTAVVLVDAGLANLYYVTAALTKDVLKISVTVPKSRAAKSGHSSAMKKFFEQIYAAIIKNFDLDTATCIIVAGPGFYKDDFFEWFKTEAHNNKVESVARNINKFLICRSSNAFKQSLRELLANPEIRKKMVDASVATQIGAFDTFISCLAKTPDKACYGPRHVQAAVENGAVRTLLLAEGLLRESSIQRRKQLVELMETVKCSPKSKVVYFSDSHPSGEQLLMVSGIAAILHFPMPELNDIPPETELDQTENNEYVADEALPSSDGGYDDFYDTT